ncbi:G5 domain-containing protein, partial [Streptococcus suis]|nr:G5 domain-containing protein [Streptococcus suis]
MKKKRLQSLLGLALVANLVNPLPWLNSTAILGSANVRAADLPPGETPPGEDEELPDAEQLALIKKISDYLSEIEALLAEGDKDTAEYLLVESDAMGGYATSIAAVSNVKNSAERAKLQVRIDAIRAQLSETVQPPSPVITTEEMVEIQALPFETVRENDPTLEEGKEVVAIEGVSGERTIIYTVTKTDGVETDRVVKSDTVTTPVINKVIKVGTKKGPVITTQDVTTVVEVDFTETRVADATMAEGTEVITTQGVKGERTIVETVTYADGVEVSRVEKSNTVTKAPVNQVVTYGTKKSVVTPNVTTKEETKTEVVPFTEVREDDPTLSEGTEVVSVEGKEGVRTIVETVTYTDGVETNRVVKSDTVTTPAINKVIKVGTKKG